MSFIRTDKTYPDEECGICLESLSDNVWEHAEVHRFHGVCITDWVKDKPSCPICREVVDTATLLGNQVLSKPPLIPRVVFGTFLVLSVSSIFLHAGQILLQPEKRQFRNALFYFELTCLAVCFVVKKYFLVPEDHGD